MPFTADTLCARTMPLNTTNQCAKKSRINEYADIRGANHNQLKSPKMDPESSTESDARAERTVTWVAQQWELQLPQLLQNLHITSNPAQWTLLPFVNRGHYDTRGEETNHQSQEPQEAGRATSSSSTLKGEAPKRKASEGEESEDRLTMVGKVSERVLLREGRHILTVLDVSTFPTGPR